MSHGSASAREQARRIEASDARTSLALAEALAAKFPRLGVASEAVAGGAMIYAGARAPLTRARGLGMNGAVTDDDVARVDQFFDDHGVAARVAVCPYADDSLASALGRRGYRTTELAYTSVCALEGASAMTAGAASRAAVRVERVGVVHADAWSCLVASGFGGDGPVPEGVLEAGIGLFAAPDAACFWAFVGDDPAPVGAGALMLDPRDTELAYLFATSTRAASRGRGVQSALIAARLAFAANAGCTLAWVSTVPATASHRNVERAGFRVVYTRVEMERARDGRAAATQTGDHR